MASNLRYRDYESPTHPMADFLTKQLPMMIQQHKQNKENRIHEKDMAQMRLDDQKELASHNADLNQKSQLKTLELEQLFGQLEEGKKLLKESDEKAQEFGIVSARYEKVSPKDATEGAVDVLKQMENNMSQERNFAVTNYSNIEATKADVMSQLKELQQAQSINNQILEGANLGERVAGLIKDADKNEILDENDVAGYFATKEAIVKNLNEIQQIGFDKSFPTAQETFYTQLDKRYQAEYRKTKAISEAADKKATTTATDVRGIHNKWISDYKGSKSTEKADLTDEFYRTINTVNLGAYDKDHFKGKPENLRSTTTSLALNLYEALNLVEHRFTSGATNDHIDNSLDAINNTADDSIKKAKMYELVQKILLDKSGYRRTPESFDKLVSGEPEETLAIWKRMDHFRELYEKERLSQAHTDQGLVFNDPYNFDD